MCWKLGGHPAIVKTDDVISNNVDTAVSDENIDSGFMNYIVKDAEIPNNVYNPIVVIDGNIDFNFTSSIVEKDAEISNADNPVVCTDENIDFNVMNSIVEKDVKVFEDVDNLIAALSDENNENVHAVNHDIEKDQSALKEVTNKNERSRKRKRSSDMILAEEEKENHPILPSCDCTIKNCSSRINDQRRKDIYDAFWFLSYNQRRNWLIHHMELLDVKRRYKEDNATSRGNYSRAYFFPD